MWPHGCATYGYGRFDPAPRSTDMPALRASTFFLCVRSGGLTARELKCEQCVNTEGAACFKHVWDLKPVNEVHHTCRATYGYGRFDPAPRSTDRYASTNFGLLCGELG